VHGSDAPGGLLAHVRRLTLYCCWTGAVVRGTCLHACAPVTKFHNAILLVGVHPSLFTRQTSHQWHMLLRYPTWVRCTFRSGVVGMCSIQESVVATAGFKLCARFTTLKRACGVVLSCAAGVCMLVCVSWFLLCSWAAGGYVVHGLS
jgi:hypothetical protein